MCRLNLKFKFKLRANCNNSLNVNNHSTNNIETKNKNIDTNIEMWDDIDNESISFECVNLCKVFLEKINKSIKKIFSNNSVVLFMIIWEVTLIIN